MENVENRRKHMNYLHKIIFLMTYTRKRPYSIWCDVSLQLKTWNENILSQIHFHKTQKTNSHQLCWERQLQTLTFVGSVSKISLSTASLQYPLPPKLISVKSLFLFFSSFLWNNQIIWSHVHDKFSSVDISAVSTEISNDILSKSTNSAKS